jgi:hypothetical protein
MGVASSLRETRTTAFEAPFLIDSEASKRESVGY